MSKITKEQLLDAVNQLRCCMRTPVPATREELLGTLGFEYKNYNAKLNTDYIVSSSNSAILVRSFGPIVIIDLYDIQFKKIVHDGSTTIIASGLPKAASWHATHISTRSYGGSHNVARIGIAQNSDKLTAWWTQETDVPLGPFSGQLIYITNEY